MQDVIDLSSMPLESHLQKLFGYSEFRLFQKDIVNAVVNQKDVLAILPTGAGKSICYQLPAMLMPGLAVVISPLISLMQDQVVSLSKKGIPAAFINSSLYYQDMLEVLENFHQYKLLYVAPERLMDQKFLQRLQSVKVSFFAIDEAHCISQWGHSFRPEYRQLSMLKKAFPNSSLMALTATATKAVEQDIVALLAMKNPYLVKASFDRPNLALRIVLKDQPSIQLDDFLKKHQKESGIIYAGTRKTVEETFLKLEKEGHKVGKYHAGMSDEERSNSQNDFISGHLNIMVATVAFGMGIHKPDIRFIVHVDMPRSIEQYYQEVGRAGRDGLQSECLMLYSYQDFAIYKSFLGSIKDEALRASSKQKLEDIFALCQTPHCRRGKLLKYFDEEYARANCNSCDNCEDNKCESAGTDEERLIIAQKILSCVYRLNENFGIKYVIDVLKGSKRIEILNRMHNELSTYGLMKEFSEDDLRHYIHSLISQGYLQQTGEYPVLKWTETTRGAIKGINKVFFAKRAAGKSLQNSNTPYAQSSRSGHQAKTDKPADSLINKFAINGEGRIKSAEETLRLFLQGSDLSQIATQRGLAKATILDHLTEQIQQGVNVDISTLVSAEKQTAIKQVISNTGVERLTPIKEQLPPEITYDDIRLVVAFYKRRDLVKE